MEKANNNSGKITKFNKRKGSEQIPWELSQDSGLSLEAIGLLVQLDSYPTNWELHKTELYTRNKKNKRTAIETIWNELVEYGYIVQYIKRTGRFYTYQYFFTVDGFTEEDLKIINSLMDEAGFSLYLNNKQKEAMRKKNAEDTKKETEHEMLMGKIRDVVNQQSNENVDASGSEKSEVHDFNSSKTTHIIKSTIKDFEEEDLIKLKILTENPKLKLVCRLLVSSGVGTKDSVRILEDIALDKSLLNPELIVEQLKWCSYKAKYEGISDFAKYYINGLRTKVSNSGVSLKNSGDDFVNEFAVKILGGMGDLNMEVPMFNWLE